MYIDRVCNVLFQVFLFFPTLYMIEQKGYQHQLTYIITYIPHTLSVNSIHEIKLQLVIIIRIRSVRLAKTWIILMCCFPAIDRKFCTPRDSNPQLRIC